jgi:hypothetical protein
VYLDEAEVLAGRFKSAVAVLLMLPLLLSL